MIYEARLTIPQNTAQADAVSTDLAIHPGTVTVLEVLFPTGCAGLAHVQIQHWARQVWPNNPNGDFSGNGSPMTFAEDYEVNDPPFFFTISGWNEDTLYPHTPIIRFQITPQTPGLLKSLANLFTGPRLLSAGK